MTAPTRPPRVIDRFAASEDGSVTLFSALFIVLILVITGAAVDIMRQEAVRAQMQGIADRAVLAAADLDQLQDPETVVNDYMTKAGISETLASVTVDRSLNHRVVSAHSETDLNTFFLRMSGYDTLDVVARSTAEERISNVEISLVLDISGSMRFNNRIAHMRPAAQNFVSKVLDEDSNGVTTLNVVPFAGHVNPGEVLFEYFRGDRPTLPPAETETEEVADFFEPWAQAISNVVFYFDLDGDNRFDRAHKIEGFPETAPRDVDEFLSGAVGFFMAYDNDLNDSAQFLGASIKGGTQSTRYFQVKGDENGPGSDLGPTNNRGRIPGWTLDYDWIDFDSYTANYTPPAPAPEPQQVNMPSSCIEIEAHEFATTEMPTSTDFVPLFHYWETDTETMDWGWCPQEDTAIHYYSSDREGLLDFLETMRMHDGTGLHIGAKYGLALLDPANRDEVRHLIANGLVDPSFDGRPIDWNDPETEKYMVIMTDGETTEQFRPNDPSAAINGEVELSRQSGAPYYTLTSKSANVGYLQQQCALAKARGVQVFTIAFETNDAAANDMRACASSESHFFRANGQQIYDAFDTVARQINNLRLVE
ncbi:pilus assembly protein TadG-related protein [Citreimonas sp.]|uniref:pilus assembly protein TadG-related protein n=1 Tax=Citreimonas sp. TaxID=3036715 RepID=UPI0035C7A673